MGFLVLVDPASLLLVAMLSGLDPSATRVEHDPVMTDHSSAIPRPYDLVHKWALSLNSRTVFYLLGHFFLRVIKDASPYVSRGTLR